MSTSLEYFKVDEAFFFLPFLPLSQTKEMLQWTVMNMLYCFWSSFCPPVTKSSSLITYYVHHCFVQMIHSANENDVTAALVSEGKSTLAVLQCSKKKVL